MLLPRRTLYHTCWKIKRTRENKNGQWGWDQDGGYWRITSSRETRNSLALISVTEETFHELRGWLNAGVYQNTVSRVLGNQENKREQEWAMRVRSGWRILMWTPLKCIIGGITSSRETRPWETTSGGTKREEIDTGTNSLAYIDMTEETCHELRGWLKAYAFANTVS